MICGGTDFPSHDPFGSRVPSRLMTKSEVVPFVSNLVCGVKVADPSSTDGDLLSWLNDGVWSGHYF